LTGFRDFRGSLGVKISKKFGNWLCTEARQRTVAIKPRNALAGCLLDELGICGAAGPMFFISMARLAVQVALLIMMNATFTLSENISSQLLKLCVGGHRSAALQMKLEKRRSKIR
jgi:hypothetical protein